MTALVVAACGGSSSTPASNAASSGSTSDANAAITVSTADVAGLGTVLVNGKGQTLYLLTSEKGGKLTCTDANGCTKVWPDTELPSGVTHGVAGSGVQASLLSTVKSDDGRLYLTYGGWPLYTYAGDSGPMQSHGQGIVSFGGTWWAISPSGDPVTSSSGAAISGGY
jgi:predicted lipoprotein with Yx(FWY)xxD motif